VGEHRAAGAQQRLLLLGHLDTVFEPSNGFLAYEAQPSGRITGPGVSDMKGGNQVIFEALEALRRTGELDRVDVTVVFTGDEEAVGLDPDGGVKTSRQPLIDLAARTDVALSFEPNASMAELVVARRGVSVFWLDVTAHPGHSSQIFQRAMGPGAIYPMARLLDRIQHGLRSETALTYNVGRLAGGTTVIGAHDGIEQTINGKVNLIPAEAHAYGDLRFVDAAQLERARATMRKIVTTELAEINRGYDPQARVSAQIGFRDKYPSMEATVANGELLEQMNRVSVDLGDGTVRAADVITQGGADVAFVAKTVRAALDGLGPTGVGIHTKAEETSLASLRQSAHRAVVLIQRLSTATTAAPAAGAKQAARPLQRADAPR
jgi:glutamate carboxypeptidase